MIQIFHPYTKWECHENGMYKRTCFMDEHQMVNECFTLLACPEWLYESMSMVTHNWFYSCEHFLSNELRNRQAYLGQAACCLLHGAPEYITKMAWSILTEQQRVDANKVADEVLEVWIEKHNRGFFKWERDTLNKTCSMLQTIE